MILFAPVISIAQPRNILAEPLLGHTELRTVKLWIQFSSQLATAMLFFKEENTTQQLRMVKAQLRGG